MRLFQSLFSCAKEGRRSTTYSRPASSELLALQRKIQDVDVENYYVTDSSGRLVCNFRTERCLFSYSGRSAAQEVPLVRFWREGLPIKGSSFWPGFGTDDVHKVHGCCSGPLRFQGIRVLNYLDDWFILVHTRESVSRYRDVVLRHIRALGLRMKTKKSVLSPSQQTVFLGVHLDSVQMQARLAPTRISSLNTCLARIKLDHRVSVSTCRRLLSLMAVASPVLPLELLHMRPFLCWMKLSGVRSTGPATAFTPF